MAPRPSRKPRNGDKPHAGKGRDKQASETADSGRDLVHGEGGTIDLPAKPGDLSKDD